MNQHLAVIERALQQHKGDDLARARAAFGRCTPDQMQEQWGSSGRTRADVLSGYEKHEAEVEAALAWAREKAATGR